MTATETTRLVSVASIAEASGQTVPAVWNMMRHYGLEPVAFYRHSTRNQRVYLFDAQEVEEAYSFSKRHAVPDLRIHTGPSEPVTDRS